ncbi:MAG: response regulator [Alphaproteobacteria bacterium]|jgi:CheY-like chemotaxis protein|nr:response regulator [Alphaproteobacteria bacterium]
MSSKEQAVFLVEDNHDDWEAMVRGFKAADFDAPIVWFKNTKEALYCLKNFSGEYEKTSKELPSLIILDLNLPGLDGREMLSIIKSTPHLKMIPVIIFTTSLDQKDVLKCYDTGANAYMQKPVNFEKMQEICESIKTYWMNTVILPKDVLKN